MSSSSSSLKLFTIVLLIIFFFCTPSNSAGVPKDKTFKYEIASGITNIDVEYAADYRPIDISTGPFQLGFYNTTPNAATFAMKLGRPRSSSVRRWVWEANRGKPVKEGATISFGTDGNLVLAEADGQVVWQTATANKGVVDCQLLPNGNWVLLDSKGKFVWQSFDYPTDTLLIGQSIRAGGVNKLVSRASNQENSNGAYSLVLEPNKGLSWFYTIPNSPNPLLYYSSADWDNRFESDDFVVPGESIKFDMQTEIDPSSGVLTRSYLSFGRTLAVPSYNATFSFLRLGIDGRLIIFTYNDHVNSSAWLEVFSQFTNDVRFVEDNDEAQLPEKCGKFGLCSKNQCVACPTEKGLLGWSEECELKKVGSCKTGDFHYYKLEGVEHYISKFNKGSSMKESDCLKKCSSDCKCLGYFYFRESESSTCWNVDDIKTLKKVDNKKHVGYIKVSNK
ncbi:epidermis-specific secreted glycoprotein EP1-like [Impatiens glandulifera]|uniref:epidermis-specific secreted glycoprotein EP1-like n=1 Tax=Impatiens glandulifera TaxID=253017 RepID=UPI001FB059E4|nr:epidermis-specific secreted glycoprotein EP1-like [Impatiens glandulifera]